MARRLDVHPTMRPSVLLTDLYELTMLEAYFDRGMNGEAVFELFVRSVRPHRNFLVAAGLEQAVDYLLNLSFAAEDLEWLRETNRFGSAFIDSLAGLRFTGDVDALPEGTIFFPDEPILRIVAPLREAQLVESRLMNLVHYQTLIASKAVRCALAAPDRMLVDFGLRRAHGAEAALMSARASYLAGFAGSATVEAGRAFGIPIFGTMAHSYVQAHDDEAAAFESFARAHPRNLTLLIDTYDTERAAHTVVALQRKLWETGIRIQGVRIDSGDLAQHASRVRAIFDAAGLRDITIFASGGLDEFAVRDLVAAGAPIDGFGIGTRMNTSADAPYLDCAYKLQEYEGRPRRKRSEGKATWPGRKQVHRSFGSDGRMARDVLALEHEAASGQPLLTPVMRRGSLAAPLPSLDVARRHLNDQLSALADGLRSLDEAPAYPVEVSAAVRSLAARVDASTGSAQAARPASDNDAGRSL